MKFWVKAVVDNKGSEQLLVQAETIDELRASLVHMLRVPIGSLSITDFQSQVVDRLRAGVEIITVWIQTQPLENNSPALPSHVATPQRDSRPASAALPGRTSTGPHAGLSSTPKSTRRNTEGITPVEESLSGVFDTHGNVLSSGQPLSRPLSRRSSWRERSTPPRDDVLKDGSAANLFSMKESLREPCVAKLCLRRDDVLTLLDPLFESKYTADLLGCFLRAKEPEGYGFYQITDVVEGDNPLILIDTVHASESRQLDTISNAPPTKSEVRAWFRKMLSTARQIPSFATVEAKAGDIDSDLSAARSALGISPESGEALLTTVAGPSALARVDDASCGPSDACAADPARPTYGIDAHTAVATPDARRRRRTQMPSASLTSVFDAFHGRSIVRTNDRLVGCGAALVRASTGDTLGAVPQFCLVVRRHANVLSKKVLRTDSAMSVILLDRDGGATSDVDAAPKGFHFLGVPCQWQALGETDAFVAIADFAEGSLSGGDGASSSSGGVPFADEESGRLVQRFVLLRGPALDCLRWQDRATTLLPIPMWAQNEGHDPHILSPMLVAVGSTLHVLYLVVIHIEEAGTRRLQSRHVYPNSLSPQPSSHGNSLGGISPQHRRHSSLMAQFDASAISPSRDAHDDDEDQHPVAAGEHASQPVSPIESLATEAYHNVTRSYERKYALVHACTTDPRMQQWTVMNSREPIVYSFDDAPLFTAFSVPSHARPADESGDTPRVDSEDSASTPQALGATSTLGIAWWDRTCGTSHTSSLETPAHLASPWRLPLMCFVYHPTEVPAADPYGRSRRGSAMDWTPVMMSSSVPCSTAFDEAESITVMASPTNTNKTCFFLAVIGQSRNRGRGATFHTPVLSAAVALTDFNVS